MLGQINFLADKASQPCMSMADVRDAFAVGESTASVKAKFISNALGTNCFDPTFMLPSVMQGNPMVWLAEVSGFTVDLRDLPREVQPAVHGKRKISHIPADKD